MKAISRLLLVALLGALAGCWPLSVNPLYEKDEGELPPGLAATWVQPGDEDFRYEFKEDATRRGYDVKVTDKDGRITMLKATAVALGDTTFLDVTPVGGSEDVPVWYMLTTLPMHAFFRMELTPDGELFITAMKEDAMAKLLKATPEALPHRMVAVYDAEGVRTAERPLLTGTTAELRAFLSKHAKDGELFADPVKLVRGEAP